MRSRRCSRDRHTSAERTLTADTPRTCLCPPRSGVRMCRLSPRPAVNASHVTVALLPVAPDALRRSTVHREVRDVGNMVCDGQFDNVGVRVIQRVVLDALKALWGHESACGQDVEPVLKGASVMRSRWRLSISRVSTVSTSCGRDLYS